MIWTCKVIGHGKMILVDIGTWIVNVQG